MKAISMDRSVLFAGDRIGAGGAIDAADPADPSLPVETVDSTYRGFYWVLREEYEGRVPRANR
ncbi:MULTISPECIES: hypothetical protein [unclassified Pseudarthrobacter]|uniref:hypothetical protein n=1 Tax=unclassified Pseudarthrobacter TaxID=2647000 RepID=UPI003077AA5C